MYVTVISICDIVRSISDRSLYVRCVALFYTRYWGMHVIRSISSVYNIVMLRSGGYDTIMRLLYVTLWGLHKWHWGQSIIMWDMYLWYYVVCMWHYETCMQYSEVHIYVILVGYVYFVFFCRSVFTKTVYMRIEWSFVTTHKEVMENCAFMPSLWVGMRLLIHLYKQISHNCHQIN